MEPGVLTYLWCSTAQGSKCVPKLVIACDYCCVISQKTILGSSILLLLMLRRKIPFAACDVEAGRSRCWGEK